MAVADEGLVLIVIGHFKLHRSPTGLEIIRYVMAQAIHWTRKGLFGAGSCGNAIVHKKQRPAQSD
jgi:hypothetical protein